MPSNTDPDDPDDVARSGTARAVKDLLRARHGADAPEDWLTGIAAARAIRFEAEQLMLRYARKARMNGRPWRDLAEPLGLADEDDPGMAAFELVARQLTIVPPDAPLRVWWDCLDCDHRIKDSGPISPDPTETEHGHTDDCDRYQAEIAAFVAWTNGAVR